MRLLEDGLKRRHRAEIVRPLGGVVDWIGLYLLEDLGNGDVTTEAAFGDETLAAQVVARERMFVAGTQRAVEVFARLGARAVARPVEASWVDAGTVIMDVSGPARAVLGAERVALNLLGRMCGVATVSRPLVETLARACAPARIAGTRKTTPGFRVFEKEALRIAGADPHRLDLSSAAMVKDNHAAAAGGLARLVATLRKRHPDLEVICEVERRDDALAAAQAGAHWILVDNQRPEVARTWAEDVWAAYPEVLVEVSGGIGPDRILEYGWADRISMGFLTRHARIMDLGLDLEGHV